MLLKEQILSFIDWSPLRRDTKNQTSRVFPACVPHPLEKEYTFLASETILELGGLNPTTNDFSIKLFIIYHAYNKGHQSLPWPLLIVKDSASFTGSLWDILLHNWLNNKGKQWTPRSDCSLFCCFVIFVAEQLLLFICHLWNSGMSPVADTWQTAMVMSECSVNPTTLFLDKLGPSNGLPVLTTAIQEANPGIDLGPLIFESDALLRYMARLLSDLGLQCMLRNFWSNILGHWGKCTEYNQYL